MSFKRFGPKGRIFLTTFLAGIILSLSAAGLCRPGDIPKPPLESELESEMFQLVNLDRMRNGLACLEMDETLAQVARQQSQGMASEGRISHALPSLGTLDQRLDAARYSRRIGRENLARASSVRQAEQALINSPAHHRNLFAGDVTHLGIGIFRDLDDDLYITQVFAEPTVLPSIGTIRESLNEQVRELRARNGMRPLEDHPVMSRLAADSVKNVDLPFNRNTLAQVLTGKQSELRRELASSGVSRIAVDVLLLHDLKDFRVPEHLCREDARVFGAAAAEVLDTNDKPAVVFLSFVALDK